MSFQTVKHNNIELILILGAKAVYRARELHGTVCLGFHRHRIVAQPEHQQYSMFIMFSISQVTFQTFQARRAEGLN